MPLRTPQPSTILNAIRPGDPGKVAQAAVQEARLSATNAMDRILGVFTYSSVLAVPLPAEKSRLNCPPLIWGTSAFPTSPSEKGLGADQCCSWTSQTHTEV